MPKMITEVINGKTYHSLAQVSREFGLSTKTVYGRHYRGEHGDDLVRKPKKGRTEKNGVYFEHNGDTYTSINSISQVLGISYNAVKRQYDKYPNPDEFKKHILAFAKSRNQIKEKANAKSDNTPIAKETPVRELRDPSMQKVGALSSLLLSFIGEFTGYTVNVNAFENAYDRGLDLSLDQFLEKSHNEDNHENIISKETLSKISSLEDNNKSLNDKITQLEKLIIDQKSEITGLKTTKKRHWWSK